MKVPSWTCLDTVGKTGVKLMPLVFHKQEYIGSLPELEKLIAESGSELFEGSAAEQGAGPDSADHVRTDWRRRLYRHQTDG